MTNHLVTRLSWQPNSLSKALPVKSVRDLKIRPSGLGLEQVIDIISWQES